MGRELGNPNTSTAILNMLFHGGLMQTARVSVRDGEPVNIDPPVMRQAIAWQFALRSVRKQEKRAAEELLKADSGADDVTDVKVGYRAR